MRIATTEEGLSNNAVQPTFKPKKCPSEKGTLQREGGAERPPDKHQHTNNQIITPKKNISLTCKQHLRYITARGRQLRRFRAIGKADFLGMNKSTSTLNE